MILSGGKNTNIARAFGISPQAVTNVLTEIERRREKGKIIAVEILSVKKLMYS